MLLTLFAAAGFYALILAFLYLNQARMVFFPEAQLGADPARLGMDFEDVFLDSGSEKLHGWYVPADSAPAPVVLFCHGNAGNISDRLEFLEHIHAAGLNVLIFDYAGYGRSTGKPDERQMYADADAAWAWLLSRGFAPEEVVAYGRSLGAAVAAYVAQDKSVRTVVLEAPFTSLPAVGAYHYPWAPVRLLLRSGFHTDRYVQRVRAPLFVIASPDDEIVPYALAKRLFETAKGPKVFLPARGGHNTLSPVDWASILEKSVPAN